MKLEDLGAWAYVFAMLVTALFVVSLWSVVLRARVPFDPIERYLTVAAFIIAFAFPLVGTLATVEGLTHSFRSVETSDPSNKATVLAKGISRSMNATALGIGLAFPSAAIAVWLLLSGAKRAPKKQRTPSSG